MCFQKSFIILVRNYLFLKNYVTSEGVISHDVLYDINSYPMLVTKSVFKLIFVLSNYQTCTFPFVYLEQLFLMSWPNEQLGENYSLRRPIPAFLRIKCRPIVAVIIITRLLLISFVDKLGRFEMLASSHQQKHQNPLLECLSEILNGSTMKNPDSRGILFCKTRNTTEALIAWIENTPSLAFLNPGRLIGSGGSGGKQMLFLLVFMLVPSYRVKRLIHIRLYP